MDFFEIIYGLMYGEYVLEGYRVPLSHIVRHEFRPGSKASRIWQRAGDARERIARRLGTDDEDPDLLAMVESYEELQEYMCRRCYEYGRLCLRPAYMLSCYSLFILSHRFQFVKTFLKVF